MFTVVFLSRSAKAIFDKAETFFDPYRKSGELAFCEWNESPDATHLSDALPELRDIIRGKPAWRAVVVDHAAGSLTPAAGERDAANPFDFVDNTRTELNLEHSPHALVRISHQLLGYPTMTAKDFEQILTHRDDAGRRAEVPVTGGDMSEALRRIGQVESDVRIEFREIPYTDSEKERHRQLADHYRMKEVSPSEVVFISTRSQVDVDARTQLESAWRVESEQQASRFVERNDYPPASRFAVYDLLNRENSGYDQDELRFWTAVLTITVNELPPSAFQADRVYRLGVEFSDTALGDLLNTHMGRLNSLREHLDLLLRRPEHPPDTDVRELMREESVPVRFEDLGDADLGVQIRRFQLASDEPTSEVAAWRDEFARLEANATQFVRRPRRVLARAVFDARVKSRSFLNEEVVLSDIERDEIEDELAKRIRSLTEPATTDILDRNRLVKLLEQQDRRVTSHLAERMRLRTIAISTLVVVGVWIGALIPYLVQASTRSLDVIMWSVFVVAAAVIVLAAAGFVTLLWMRHRLAALMRDVNAVMHEYASRVNSGAEVFGAYLSRLATYMRARAILIGAGRLRERDRARLRHLTALRMRTEAAIDAERGIVTSLGQPLSVRRLTTGFAQFDAEDPAQVEAFFRFDVGERGAEFNDSGEMVRAPYDFVTRLTLERLRLFESPSGRTIGPATVASLPADVEASA